jgi:gas vesicle protein
VNGASDRVSDRGRANARDQQYDLLTAAVLGAMIGAGAALLLRRGPTGRRPISPVARAAGGAAVSAARWAGKGGRQSARWAAKRGEQLWDRVPVDAVREEIGDALDSAREAVANVVESELRDLRKAIRRQRKRLGV